MVDLDHYGLGQTRSKSGPCDQVLSKSVNIEGQKCRPETDREAGWFLWPDCTPRSECPQFRTCPDPEFPNALHSEFMNTPNVEFLNVPLCSVPMSYLAGSKWGRPLCALVLAARTGVWRPYLRYGDSGRLQNVSPPSVLFESIQIFFTIHRRHRCKK